MLYIRPAGASDACHIETVTFGNEFSLIRTQSLMRRALGRKLFVLSTAPKALLQLFHYRCEYERAKGISHNSPVRRAASEARCSRNALYTNGRLLVMFRRLQIGDAP